MEMEWFSNENLLEKKKWAFEKRIEVKIWIKNEKNKIRNAPRVEEQEMKPRVPHQPIKSREMIDDERSMSGIYFLKQLLKYLEIQMKELIQKQIETTGRKQKSLWTEDYRIERNNKMHHKDMSEERRMKNSRKQITAGV